ncbi:hypothetical protein SAMN05421821_101322 [Mucilaginibacter lappiensis]|nr:hypothetical protein SAMN05421821_101322 [Mucilaginibacter lappiensis]
MEISKSLASTSKILATSNNLLMDGWAELVHQLETVSGVIFRESAKSMLLFPFSAKTDFIRLYVVLLIFSDVKQI